MNFDLSNILTRSGQITWRHKSIWGLLLLPIVVAFLPFLMLAIFFLAIMRIVEWNIPDFMYIGFGLFFLLTLVVSTLVNYAVRAASSSRPRWELSALNEGKAQPISWICSRMVCHISGVSLGSWQWST